MSRHSFAYERPRSLSELWSVLGQNSQGTRFLAGGTDILVKYKRQAVSFNRLIDLKGIPGLRGIDWDESGRLRIGALTTLNELKKNPLLTKYIPVLAAAAGKMAAVQVRNRATIGGNLCNAAPSADLAPPLLALDAAVHLETEHGHREVALTDFFTGPGQTILAPGEILAWVMVPPLGLGMRVVYLKQGLRQAMDIAVAGVAVKLEISNGTCTGAAIALGAVAPVPMRAYAAEKLLHGQPVNTNSISRAAELAGQEAAPISDVRAEADYRRQLVAALVHKGLRQCTIEVGEQEGA